MSDTSSRTFIGSIVCVDLVGYSTRSVAQQIAIKDVFNRLLGQALERIPEEDRIILDTGDGASISFLGDPEQSLAVGLAVRDAMQANAAALGAAEGAAGAVRMGIHLGPVKLAVDMNGYPKIIGDGLNVAERIMGFAQPGQIAVSRAFFEMVSRLSDENAKLFRFEGTRTDKNAREHQVYVIDSGTGGAKRGRAPARAAGSAAETGAPGALAAFLENKRMVASAAAVLLALILGESYLLARKWRAAAAELAVARAEPSKAASTSASSARALAEPPAKPTVAPSPPASAPAPAKAQEARTAAKPETRPEPAKPEARSEPAKPEPAKPEPPKPEPPKVAARRDEPARAASDAISNVPANLVSIAPLNFPAEAAARGINTGSVKARLTIDAQGDVTRVQVLEANPRRFFDEEAIRSLRDWKFDRGPANRQYVADIQFKK